MGDDSDIRVSGGGSGVYARYDDMMSYAKVLDDAGDGLRTTSGHLVSMVDSADLAQALVLCPGEVATAEGAIIAAATGPSVAFWTSNELEISARYLRAAVDTYIVLDEKLANLADFGEDAAGFALGLALPGLILAGGVAYLGVKSNPQLEALLDRLGIEEPTLEDLQKTIYDNPWLADALTRMAPGIVQGTGYSLAGIFGPPGIAALTAASGGNWPTTDYASAITGLLSIAGRGGLLRDTGDFTVDRVPGEPREIDIDSSNIVSTIFDQQGQLSGNEGQVQVITVDHPGGDPSYVVQIPGTQEWSPVRGDNPVDATTNVVLMAMGKHTIMEQQVADAMAAAGIKPGDPVMLTGHSQGGITAAAMASDPSLHDKYNITSVVTGGSPIGRFDIPDDASVLSLEHDQDVVPMLDGADNPDRSNWVTVERKLTDDEGAVNGGVRGPAGAHDLRNYSETGAQVDQSGSETLEQWREHNQQFMDGTATGTRYQISPSP